MGTTSNVDAGGFYAVYYYITPPIQSKIMRLINFMRII
jgi:hypothetical protein